MKKKLNLKELKVNSFVTDLKEEKVDTVKGGIGPSQILCTATQTLIGPQCYTNLCNVTNTCPPPSALCTAYTCPPTNTCPPPPPGSQACTQGYCGSGPYACP